MTAGPSSAPPAAGAPAAYAMREARADDLPEILALLGSNLSDTGVTAKTEAFWSWKHVEPPAGPSIVYVATAEETGGIVGLRAVMRVALSAPDGELVRAVRPVDTVTHSGWQRRGIFSKLTLSLIDGLRDGPIAMLFNTPNENSLPAYLKLGWQVAQVDSIRVRPAMNPFKVWRNFKPSADSAAQTRHMRNGLRISIGRFADLAESDREQMLRACETYESQRASKGLRTRRNAETLAWRYAHPTADYRVLQIRRGDSDLPVAAAFFRYESRKGVRGVLLTDFFCGREVSFRELLKACCRSIEAGFFVACASDGSRENAELARAFFLPVRKVKLAQRPVELERPQAFAARANWDLTLADIELF